MKLFGKELFVSVTQDEELYDFAKHGLLRETNHIGWNDINLMEVSGDDERSAEYMESVSTNNRKAKEKEKKKQKDLTPKEVYNLKTLNDDTYVLNTDENYIKKVVKSISAKQSLLPQPKIRKKSRRHSHDVFVEISDSAYGASKYGFEEMGSLIERVENRRLYKANEAFFDQYPYTRSDLINDVIAAHTNLRAKRVEEFIPDMPDEAIEAMTAYNDKVKEMCGKKAVFYIIADKKDFGEIDKKRDPILLAQSPFALAWQILGAWDEEMIYLGDL